MQSDASVQLGERILGAFQGCLHQRRRRASRRLWVFPASRDSRGSCPSLPRQPCRNSSARTLVWRFPGRRLRRASVASRGCAPRPGMGLRRAVEVPGGRGSSALHRVAQVWGGRGLSQPGLALVHRFRNRFCSCPAGAPLPPAVAMVKPQLANQSLAGGRARSRRCDCACPLGPGLGTGGLGWRLSRWRAPVPCRHHTAGTGGSWPGTGPRHTLEPGSGPVPGSQSSPLVSRPSETPTPTLRESLPLLGPRPRPSSPWGTAPEPSPAFPCIGNLT